MNNQVVRIGCGGGFWGDTPEGVRQLFERDRLDYLVMDYLAEVTMSILARMRQKDPAQGYVPDFLQHAIAPYAARIRDEGIKLVANAGGVNPKACKEAIERELDRLGIPLKVIAVTGDDVMLQLEALRADGVKEMFNGQPLPKAVLSANAYLGAFPIAAALAAGADIVVTGRCVDSALVLGPLIYEFGWKPQDHDLLAAGSLAGHVLECGAQATGGFFTDWELAKDGWDDIGFPVAECHADGSFVATKPSGTGGIVTTNVIAEQITYEVGDPACYVLPDVVCDFSEVRLLQVGPDRVEVRGARGLPPTPTYKVCATWADGFRCLATLLVKGRDAAPKAQAVADAILRRTRRIFAREGWPDYQETSVELIGSEHTYGEHARTTATREIVLKIGVRHRDARALEVFSREIYPASTATVQGIGGVFGGRPRVQPLVRLFSFLLPKEKVQVSLDTGTLAPLDLSPPWASAELTVRVRHEPAAFSPAGPTVQLPLVKLAVARSGDKGDISSIAVIARRPEYLPLLWSQLTPEAVGRYMRHLVRGRIERFPWPGLNGMNILMHEALGGGGVASLRFDPQGKGHAQTLIDFLIDVPQAWIDDGRIVS